MADEDLETLERPQAEGHDDDNGDDAEQFVAVEEGEGEGTGEDDERAGEQGESARRGKTGRSRSAARRQAAARDRQMINQLSNEVRQLSTKLQEVERGRVTDSIGDMDAQIEEEVAKFRSAEEEIALAVQEQRGSDVVKAMRRRDSALASAQALEARRDSAKVKADTRVAPTLPAQAVAFGQQWLSDNSWYNPNANDAESRKVKAIDKALLGEGADPATEEYWDELTDRVAEALPHHFKEDNRVADHQEEENHRPGPVARRDRPATPAATRRGPPTGGGARNGGRVTEVKVSADRKAAMIEAGKWEDPKLRARALRSYAEYDARNK